MGCGSSFHRPDATTSIHSHSENSTKSKPADNVLVLANKPEYDESQKVYAASAEPADDTDDCWDKAVLDFAAYLGMDADTDAELLWIARVAIAPHLPSPWQQLETEDGHPYFVHGETRRTQWEHPLDEYHRGLFLFLRDQRRESAALAALAAETAAEAAGLPPPAAQAPGRDARQAAALLARVRLIRRAGQAAHERDEARERARLAAASRAIAHGSTHGCGGSGGSGGSGGRDRRGGGSAGLQRA